MKKFIHNNALSIVFFLLFLLAIGGQAFTGFKEHNKTRNEEGQVPLTFSQYISSPHFAEATFENWESEFLQMGMYVLITVWLYQQGSSESKKLDEAE